MNSQLRKATLKERILFRLGFFRAVRVQGNSMAPTINDGEVVLHDPRALPAVGDIIFVSHPYMQNVKIMKRISEINGEGNMTLTGDNPADSTDSRTFGLIPIKSSLGRVICRLK